MTALNYENDRMKRKPLECSYDDLPATGSWADQARYFEGRRDFRGSISRAPRDPVKSNRIPTREAEYAQLTAYVAHASHNDFWRKPAVQRTDLLKAISRLHYKCLQNGPATTSEDKALLLQAIDLIRRGRFTH